MRCLESILKQDYQTVEVIISDDSPDEDIKHAIQPYKDKLKIAYHHNRPSLGSPQNWNAALDKGSGEYLLLLHQDDWFHSTYALSSFLNALEQHKADFVFCQNTAIDEKGNKIILQAIPSLLKEMSAKPNHLLLAQVIGPPSNTMLKRIIDIRYDERLIWLVDVDYYSRILKKGYRYHYIPEHLVSIGMHDDQTTVFCRTHPEIIVRENILFAGKIGAHSFSDLKLFDYYWRLLRNYHIRSLAQLRSGDLYDEEIPAIILHMLNFQKFIPMPLLQLGVFSKLLMGLNYISWKIKSG